MNNNSAGTPVVRAAIKRFPDIPSLSLAKKLYAEHPELWVNLEGCRNSIRYFRGNRGEACRANAKDKNLFKSPGKSCDPTKLPTSYKRKWEPFLLEGNKIGILNDIHLPFHCNTSLKAAITYLKKRKVDTILLNGDTLDFYQLSRFEKDPRERKTHEEIKAARQFLDYLSENFPKAKIFWKDGNHDERLQSLLRVKAPELLDIPEFRIPYLLSFSDRGIGYITEKQLIEVEDLTILHGHEYATPIIGPVNAARGLFLRAKANSLVGHHHQTSEHTESTIQKKMITTWSVGCLCDLHPRYMPINKWNAGFAVVERGQGWFEVENKRILNGKVL
jgi:predicted phosphodiesterase